ncbi:MAG TPA: hypothetical protein VGQ30_01325, partial [Gemmatimonadaceae bacterium]|nr:hypothetical protein [Gemmatimonadaceae bacterium]
MSDRRMLRVLMSTVLLCPLNAIAQSNAPPTGGWRTAWSYEGSKGPDHWGALDPDYAICNTGREQSPVDITTTAKGALPAVRFEYKNGPVRMINNGFTAVRVNY